MTTKTPDPKHTDQLRQWAEDERDDLADRIYRKQQELDAVRRELDELRSAASEHLAEVDREKVLPEQLALTADRLRSLVGVED